MLLPLLTTAPAFAVLAWWSLDSGGYFRVDWLPGILVLLALCLVAAWALGASFRPSSRAVTVAVWALAAYSLWSFASIAWADARGLAFEGAQRTLLYLGWFVLFALVPWTTRAARAAVLGAVLLIGVVGAITLARVAAAADPLRFFVDARLAAPLGYQNATAALWSMGALPGLVLAARRETPLLLRPLLLTLSGLLMALGVMTQSRGWLFTLPLIACLMLAVVPGRVRILIFAAPVVVAVALAAGPVLEIYAVAGGLFPHQAKPIAGPPVDEAVSAIVWLTVGLLVAGLAMVIVDSRLIARIAISQRVRRGAARAALAATIIALAAAGAWAHTQNLSGRADRAWTDFQQTSNRNADGTAREQRLTSVEGARYDYWRVGLDLWREHPVIGAGQDNYAQAYFRSRRTTNEPRWVHSLPLRVLAHTGVAGAMLFAVFLLAVTWGISLAWRPRIAVAERAVIAAAGLPLLIWVVHGSVDWLWEFPLLSCLALAGAGIAMTGSGGAGDAAIARVRGPSRARVLGAAAAASVAVVIVTPSYIAVRDVRDASARWPTDPSAAIARLDRAHKLDVFGVDAVLVKGLILAEMGRSEQAHRALLAAAEREPGNWLPWFELGLVADGRSARAGTATAAEYLATAARLNPREPIIDEARRRLRSDRAMTVTEAKMRFRQRTARLER